MARVEKEEGGPTEARNKSRCLLTLESLTDHWTPQLSPFIFYFPLLPVVWSLPARQSRDTPTHALILYLPRVLRVPRLRVWLEGVFHLAPGLSFVLPSFARLYPLSVCSSNLVLRPSVLSLQPNKVYIGGLPEHTRKEDLESCFGKIGTILNVELKYAR
jgi:hypothetical protein